METVVARLDRAIQYCRAIPSAAAVQPEPHRSINDAREYWFARSGRAMTAVHGRKLCAHH
jgi:hypothetical protein